MSSNRQERLLRGIVACANLYQQHLMDKNLLFVFADQHIETLFEQTSFKHLTGAQTNISARDFYRRALTDRLHLNDFQETYFMHTKLSILDQLMNIGKTATQVGTLPDSMQHTAFTLKTDYLIESREEIQTACLGFVRDKKTRKFYVPNTALQDTLHNRGPILGPVVLVAEKAMRDARYTRLLQAPGNQPAILTPQDSENYIGSVMMVSDRMKVCWQLSGQGIVEHELPDLEKTLNKSIKVGDHLSVGYSKGHSFAEEAKEAVPGSTHIGKVVLVTDNHVYQVTEKGFVVHKVQSLDVKPTLGNDLWIGYCKEKGYTRQAKPHELDRGQHQGR